MKKNKMTTAARTCADSINWLYANTPTEMHEKVDRVRDDVGNALAVAGLCETSQFNEIARTLRP